MRRIGNGAVDFSTAQGARLPIAVAERRAAPPRMPATTFVERAAGLYAERRARDALFGPRARLFGEPAWDLLLDLFVAQGRGRSLSVGDACVSARAKHTTGLRCIRALEQRGLVRVVQDPHDGRRRLVVLSELGLDLMQRALSD